MKYLRQKLGSNHLKERIIWAAILLLVIFFATVVISYYLLPEGVLKNKNPAQSWETSDNTLILTFQIFFYNMLSVLIISLASLFGKKESGEDNYLSIGYMTFYTLIVINGIVLGTWSFSVESDAVALLERIIHIFDLAHRAAFWEMTGQLLIVCAIAHISVFQSSGNSTTKRNLKEIRLQNSEKTALLIGIIFMLIGAVVESLSIHALV
ncbi:MAG: hypothetical protein GX260_03870 [Tissierellia bacterium]|nr:hypothetical protein [Bacillota bacterium]NLL22901.1 hypothetical protein [Tissierellia bacterium]